MRRDDYEEDLRRMEYEYHQRLKAVQEALNKAGLEMDRKGVVRYTGNPSNAAIAPTYQAEQFMRVRSYEVETRMADIEGVAINGVRTVIKVYNEIEGNKPMPETLENQLREIQEEVTKATNFVIGQRAGYAENGYYR